MTKDHVVTFRMDDDLLKQVDEITNKYRYYKRSHFIQAGLRIMVELEKRGLASQALGYYPTWDEIVTLDFKKRRKVK